MKANPNKFYLLLTDTYCQGLDVSNEKIENSFCEKLLGIKIDIKLYLIRRNIETLRKKFSQKINALVRISSDMTFQQRKLIFNSFVISLSLIAQLFGCFITDGYVVALITCTREPYYYLSRSHNIFP